MAAAQSARRSLGDLRHDAQARQRRRGGLRDSTAAAQTLRDLILGEARSMARSLCRSPGASALSRVEREELPRARHPLELVAATVPGSKLRFGNCLADR